MQLEFTCYCFCLRVHAKRSKDYSSSGSEGEADSEYVESAADDGDEEEQTFQVHILILAPSTGIFSSLCIQELACLSLMAIFLCSSLLLSTA